MKIIVAVLPLLFAQLALSAPDSKQTAQATIDESKFCYYADKEFSEGAILVQEGYPMICTMAQERSAKDNRSKKEILIWKSLEASK